MKSLIIGGTKIGGRSSLPTFIQFSLGASFWVLYGFHLQDGVVVGANITILLTLIIAIVLYIYYYT